MEKNPSEPTKRVIPYYEPSFRPSPEALLSQDVSSVMQLFTPGVKFLQPDDNPFCERVVLNSYPRSGNSMMRKYLEQIT